MKIECVEFYPLKGKRKKKLGTLHVYLPDLDLDVRGVSVCIGNKGRYFIQPPSMVGPEGDKYPNVSFVNADRQKDFMQSLINEGNKFLKEWMKQNG